MLNIWLYILFHFRGFSYFHFFKNIICPLVMGGIIIFFLTSCFALTTPVEYQFLISLLILLLSIILTFFKCNVSLLFIPLCHSMSEKELFLIISQCISLIFVPFFYIINLLFILLVFLFTSIEGVCCAHTNS